MSSKRLRSRGTADLKIDQLKKRYKEYQQCREIDGQRLLLADLGHSSIPTLHNVPDIISWETVATAQQEQRAGLLFITGVPKTFITNAPRGDTMLNHDKDLRRLFTRWKSEGILTNGSAIAVLWDPKYWHAHAFIPAEITEYPVQRTALCFELRRVTTRSAADEDHVHVILTKVHRGTAQSGHQLQAHDRVTLWKSMLDRVSRGGSKWLIGGSLATGVVQLAVNIKEFNQDLNRERQRDLNPTRTFSSDKTLACVAQGIHLASAVNHDAKQILVVELDSNVQTTCSESSVPQFRRC